MNRRKKLGINFLRDPVIAKRIVSSVDCEDKDVLEIGPGMGSLTKFIENYRTLTLIEMEDEFEPFLRLNFPGARIIIADALNVKWPHFQVFISNMPYSISTPLLEKLWGNDFDVGVITIQKEVADRILASPHTKDFSRLSIMMQLKFSMRKIFDIPPWKFYPEPSVYSTVIRLEKNEKYIPEQFDSFLKILFSQRRKKIRNIINQEFFGDNRPEELNIDQLLELYRRFSEKQQF